MDSRGARILGEPGLAELCRRPVTVATLTALEAFDPDSLSDEQRVLYLRAVQRAESHFAGRRLEAVARLGRSVEGEGKTLAQDATVAEVGIALRVAPRTAVNEIHRAKRLARDLPGVLGAMTSGELTFCHGLAVLDATREVTDPAVLVALQARILPAAARKSAGQLRQAVRRLIGRLDPHALERRHAAARQDADVTLSPTDDAMAYLTEPAWASLPSPAGGAVVGRRTR